MKPDNEEFEILRTSNASLSKGLAFVHLHISTSEDINDSIPLKALHDSGCEKSILSYETFRKLPGWRQTRLQPAPNCMVSAFDGTMTPVKGILTIVMHFTGCNGIHKSFQHTVVVSDATAHDFMIGADFLLTARRLMENSTHMFLADKYLGISYPNPDIIDTSECCKVPLIRPANRWVSAISTRTITIPPNCTASVPCRLSMTNMGLTDTQVPFEVALVTLPYASAPEAVCYLQDYGNFDILIKNDSYDDLMIYPGTDFAQIEIYDTETKIYPITVTPGNATQFFSINKVAFIESDEYMSEEEKEKAFNEFLEEGKFTPSMSEYITSKNTVVDFYVKDLETHPFEEQFKLDHLSPSHKAYALKKFREVKSVFSKHDYDLGKAKNFEMDIEVDETKPRIQKYYALPLKVRDEFRKALDQMVEYGIIRQCNEASLFCSNLLVTRRKNGLLRILLDGRLLNNATIRKPMNLITSCETFAHLAQKPHVSVMDMSHSFFQIPLSAKAQPLTAFFSQTHGRRFCFTRAPQGLKNSPLYLKLLLDDTLGHLAHYVLTYADDIMIATDKDLRHHIDIVTEVLDCLRRRGLKMRPSKINLATPTVEFLGVIWERGKLRVPEAKLLSFKDYPAPTTPKKVKSFLGALSFYRTFIPRFAEMAKPLMDSTLVDPKAFKWTPDLQEAFSKLLNSFLNYAVLTLPDPTKPYYVQTDASDFAAAGRVFQKDDQDNELIIACVSRTFTKAEKSYSTVRKETLSLLYTLRTMHFFLAYASRLILLTDAKAIIHLRFSKDNKDILQRFAQEIATYEAELFHIPGKDNIVSDVLSRNQYNLDQVIAESRAITYLSEAESLQILKRLTIPYGTYFSREEVANLLELPSLPAPLQPKKKKSSAKAGPRVLQSLPKTLGKKNKKLPPTSSTRTSGVVLPAQSSQIVAVNAINVTRQDLTEMCQIAMDGIVSRKELIAAQKFDPEWEETYKTLPQPYFLHQKILWYEDKTDKARIVLPTSLIKPLLNAKHYSIHGIHHSITRIKRDVNFLYKTDRTALQRELNSLKASCITCQLNGNIPAQHPFKRFDHITRPKTIWAVDIVPSMPTSDRGNSAIFIAVDMFSAYIVVKPIPSRAGQNLLEAVESCIIGPFGIPKYIRCDNEAGLENSAEFYKFCQSLNIDVLPTAAAAPWSNGAAERAVQTIKKNLRNFVLHEHTISDWDKHVFLVAAAHNGSIGTYGVSPEEVLFGYHYHNHAEIVQMFPTDMTPDQYVDHIMSKANEARNKMREASDKQVARVMTYRNRNKPDKTFSVGDTVLVRQHQVAVGPHGAVKAKFTGPYFIESLNPDGCTCMVTHGKTGQTTSQHFSHLQKLYHDPEYSRLPSNFDDSIVQLLPDKYSHARYLQSQRFSQQSPSRRNVRFGSDTQHGADSHQQGPQPQDGADNDLPGTQLQDGADDNPLNQDSNTEDYYGTDVSRQDSHRGKHNTSPPKSQNGADVQTQHQDSYNFGNDSVFGDSQPPDIDLTQSQGRVTSPTSVDARDWNRLHGQPRRDKKTHFKTRHRYLIRARPTDRKAKPFRIQDIQREADAVVLTATNDVARVIITEPDDPSGNTEVAVHSIPGQFITKVDTNRRTHPIQVTVHLTPEDDLIRNLPQLDLRQQKIQRPPRVQAKNPYERKLNSYARPGNQSRYNLRSKQLPHPSNNAQVKCFQPP